MAKTDAIIRKAAGAQTVADFESACGLLPDATALDSWSDATTKDTALHLAAARGHADVVDAMLGKMKEGAARRKNKEGKTPACVALERPDDSGVFGVFLARGAVKASGTVGDNGEAYIVYCGLKGHLNSLQALLDAGADPDTATREDHPLLFMVTATFALQRNNDAALSARLQQAAVALLRGGAKADARGPGDFTPLHIAGEIGSVDLIEALLEHGATRDVQNIEKKTPADMAAEWGHVDAVALLLGGAGQEENARKMVADKAERAKNLAAEAGEQKRAALIPGPEDPSEEKYAKCKLDGNRAFVDQDFAKAFELYTQALRHKTDDSTLWSNAAAAALRMGDGRLEDAMRHARVARTVDTGNVKAWYREGQAAQRMKLWTDAASAYYEAFLVNNDAPAGRRIGGIDLAALVKECVENGRKEHNASNGGGGGGGSGGSGGGGSGKKS